MAKKKLVPPPKDPKPGYDPNAGTQVGEREYNLNSVTRYNADQFLKNQATAGSMITPGFKEMRYFMDWLQQFANVNRDEYNTNPFSELKANPLMAQLNAGINPYPGTRGYIPPTAKSRGAPPPPFGPMPKPIPGPMPPGNKNPPSMPPPKFPSPRPQLPRPEQPMQPPKKITPKQIKPTLNSYIPRYERD